MGSLLRSATGNAKAIVPVIVWLLWNAGTSGAVVVPNGLENTPGNSNNGFPFNCARPPDFLTSMRYQQVYRGSEVGTGSISEIHFRQNVTFGMPFGPTVIPGMTITLSSTLQPPDGLSATFATNVGPDATVVFSGDLTLSSAASSDIPRPFDIVIPLMTQFPFSPTAGKNLLLDVRIPTCVITSDMEAHVVGGDSVSRATTRFNDVNSPTADLVDTLGLTTEFVFGSSAPSLSPVALAFSAVLLFLGGAWLTRRKYA